VTLAGGSVKKMGTGLWWGNHAILGTVKKKVGEKVKKRGKAIQKSLKKLGQAKDINRKGMGEATNAITNGSKHHQSAPTRPTAKKKGCQCGGTVRHGQGPESRMIQLP